jgi:hypothetical protein
MQTASTGTAAQSEAADGPLLVSSRDRNAEPTLCRLEARLLSFYSGNCAYYETATASDKTHFIEPIISIARRISERKSRVRVLELGAGISQLPDALFHALPRGAVEFVAQDVNDTNVAFYSNRGCKLLVGTLDDLHAEWVRTRLIPEYDIIVSFFTYEHLTRPMRYLEITSSILSELGALVVICPKYTAPFYIPPAVRHLDLLSQLSTNLRLLLNSLAVRVGAKPRFFVVSDPAIFHGGWSRDFDAVHMVSEVDFRTFMAARGWRTRNLAVRYPGLKSSIMGRLMQMCVVATRD